MFRSEIALDINQKEILDIIAFIKSRKIKKRVTRASIIRDCINYWLEHVGKKEFSDSELIQMNPSMLNAIEEAKEDLKHGRVYSHEEMLKELKK